MGQEPAAGQGTWQIRRKLKMAGQSALAKVSNFNAAARLQEARLRVELFVTAGILWRECFSDMDREILGQNFIAAYKQHGTIGMWQTIHGGSETRAVIEVGLRTEHLDQQRYKWLLREFEGIQENTDPTRPRWDSVEGKLYYQNRVVKEPAIREPPTA